MSPKQMTELTQALGNLTNATSVISETAKKLGEWDKELEEKGTNLMQLEERLSRKERELEEREKRVQQTEERMQWYYVAVNRIEENVAKVGPVVKLNVGTEFVSPHFRISYLSVLFSLSRPFLSFSPPFPSH
jgi:DNA repair ATPase RecN